MDTPEIDFAIVMTSGPETPQRLASPFFLAATAAAEDMTVVVYFTGMGTQLLKRGVAESVYPKAGGKSVKQFMDLALENGAQFVLCKTSMDLFDISESDIVFNAPGVSVAAALPYLESSKRLLSF